MKTMLNVLESQSSGQTISVSSLTSPVLNEAEELRRQQLAIEREVSALISLNDKVERVKINE